MKTIQPKKSGPEHKWYAPGVTVNDEVLPPSNDLFAVSKKLDHE